MTTEPNPQSNKPSQHPQSDLKASDFFPPGVGWNQADKKRDEDIERERQKAEEEAAKRDNH